MFTRIRHFLAAPAFEDQDKTRVAGLLNVILLAILPLSVMYGIASLFIYPDPLHRLVITGTVIPPVLGMLFLMRRGRVQFASTLTSSTVWVIMTLAAITAGGVRAPGFNGYIIVILIAGLLLGGRVGFGFAGLSVLAGLGMLYAEISDILPPFSVSHTPVTMWVSQAVFFFLAAVLLYLATRSINDALERARRKERALAESNRELQLEITGRVQAEEALKTYARQQAALFQLSADLAVTLDEADVCREVVRGLHDTLGYDYLGLFLVDEGTGERVHRGSIGWPDAPSNWRIPPGRGLSERALLDGQLHCTPDVTRDPRYVPGLNSGAEVDVPLRIGEKVLGVLVVESKQPNAFDQDDFAVLTAAANQAAIALENARLFEESQRRAEEMAALRQVNLATLSSLERHQVFEIMLDQLGTVIDYDTAAIKVITPDGKDKMVAGRGPVIYDQAMWNGFNAKDSKLVQEMKETRQPVVVHDVHTDERYERVGNWEAFHSWVGAPLFVRGDMIGYLAVEKTFPGFYDENAVQLLGDFARAAAIALENARLYEDIRRERDYSQTLIATANALVVGLDLEGRITLFNDFCAEVTGYRRDEVRGRDWITTLLPERERLPARQAFRDLVEQGLPRQYEKPILTKDGRERVIAWSSTVIRDAAERLASVLAIGQDVTERKRAEEALRVSEERFALAVQGSNDGLWDWDILNNSLYWSPRLKELLGYADDELDVDFERFDSHLHPDDRERMGTAIEAHLKDRGLYDVEQRLRTKSGQYRWFRARGQALWDEAGNPVRMIGFTTDITERKRAEEQLQHYAAELEQANEELKRFTYIASHNLRAPLVNLKGFAAELRAALAVTGSAVITALPHLDEKRRQTVTTALQEDVPEALGFIDSSVTRMDRLVNALLELSRLDLRELKLEPIDMNALVQVTLQTLAHQIEEGQVKVTVGRLPEVVADRASMEQIMGNLLTNAVLYLNPGRPGEIGITGERDHDETTFRVRDNGRGIAEKDMAKVFAPFRRAGRQDVPGEGMGLSYVQALVRRHGGRIWCESEPGMGTTFTFTLSNHLEIGGDHV